jgi:quinoprotein glucose dehydrogenase
MHNKAGALPPLILGGIIALIGFVLTVGGIYLTALGGSAYYVLAGVALLASGALLIRRNILGGWLYCAIFVLTVIWALAEAGTNNWALVPRVIAPLVLLVATLLIMSTLSSGPYRWKLGLGASAAAVTLTAVTGLIFARMADTGPISQLPELRFDMGDPSPMSAGDDWPAYGGTYAARRFSPLGQITAGNVKNLKRIWVTHTGDMPSSDKIAKTYDGENTPLKVGDMLYVCTPKNIVLALDPATGKQRWKFDPKVSDEAIPYTAACRGVSYFAVPGAPADQPCARRIVYGTLDARLFALDARTGARCAGFGSNGEVDTKIGMGDTPPGYVSINSPPTIVQGVVVTGHQVLDGQDRWAPSGVIRGYDAITGKLRWAWDMMHPDWNGYPPPGQTWTRGTPNMWTTASGDEQLGLVYLPMGNAAADY